MASSCPICDDRKFRKTFEELVLGGGDLSAAKKLCESELILPEGKSVSTYRIKAHVLEHTTIEPDRIHESFHKARRRDPAEVAAERIEKEARGAVVETYLDEIASINIEEVLKSMGIAKRPDSMGDVLTLAQELSVGLNMLAGAIAIDRLQKYARDPEGRRYPSVELKGAQSTAEMMGQAFGYTNAVNLQSAVDALERAGYEVIERGNTDKQQLPPTGEV